MQRLIAIAFSAVMFTAALTGCDQGSAGQASGSPPTAVKASAPSGTAHAAADVKPGSHEDWCGEHGVAESQCTRCNAELIPAFKATGDWCEEHGVPESQCLKCNPDLKLVRPPKAE